MGLLICGQVNLLYNYAMAICLNAGTPPESAGVVCAALHFSQVHGFPEGDSAKDAELGVVGFGCTKECQKSAPHPFGLRLGGMFGLEGRLNVTQVLSLQATPGAPLQCQCLVREQVSMPSLTNLGVQAMRAEDGPSLSMDQQLRRLQQLQVSHCLSG